MLKDISNTLEEIYEPERTPEDPTEVAHELIDSPLPAAFSPDHGASFASKALMSFGLTASSKKGNRKNDDDCGFGKDQKPCVVESERDKEPPIDMTEIPDFQDASEAGISMDTIGSTNNLLHNAPAAESFRGPPDDLTKDRDVLKVFYCLLRAAGWLLNRDDKTERAAWIVRKNDGKYEGVRWPWSAESGQERWEGELPRGYVAIVHTHPPTASSRPSTTGGTTGRGDQGTADRVNVPVYVITRDAIWKAVPGGKKPEAVVEGDWWKTFRKEKTQCP